MYAKSAEKRELILEGARQVFLQKGYAATSMKDIIEACGISRGGLYFHFASVDEVFVEVLKSRKRVAAAMFDELVASAESFESLLEEYFNYQKERLMHMDRSLLSATIEYGLRHRAEADRAFLAGLYAGTEAVISQVLAHGVEGGALPAERVKALADHILFTIEGMSIKAMTAGVDPAVMDTQFTLLTRQILAQKGEDDDEKQ